MCSDGSYIKNPQGSKGSTGRSFKIHLGLSLLVKSPINHDMLSKKQDSAGIQSG